MIHFQAETEKRKEKSERKAEAMIRLRREDEVVTNKELGVNGAPEELALPGPSKARPSEIKRGLRPKLAKLVPPELSDSDRDHSDENEFYDSDEHAEYVPGMPYDSGEDTDEENHRVLSKTRPPPTPTEPKSKRTKHPQNPGPSSSLQVEVPENVPARKRKFSNRYVNSSDILMYRSETEKVTAMANILRRSRKRALPYEDAVRSLPKPAPGPYETREAMLARHKRQIDDWEAQRTKMLEDQKKELEVVEFRERVHKRVLQHPTTSKRDINISRDLQFIRPIENLLSIFQNP